MPAQENKRVRDALAEGTRILQKAGIETARLDAEVLLAELTGRSRATLLAHAEDTLSPAQWQQYRALLIRRARGEPVAYLLGYTWFYGLRLFVTPDVLIPRPETEILVERALELAQRIGGPLHMADVGTGSGAIAVAMGVHVHNARLWATDISPRALRVAQKNLRLYNLTPRTLLVQADLLTPLIGPFDLILANLPYIGFNEVDVVDPRVRAFEPSEALWAGANGLSHISRLLEQATTRIGPEGVILLEIGYRQGDAVQRLARTFFPHAHIRLHKDLAGHPRVLEVQT